MKHLFTDVDGCLSGGPGTAFDLNALSDLKKLLRNRDINLYLVSGRSQAYLETLSQALDSHLPYFCENGAAVYDPKKGRYIYSVDANGLTGVQSELIEISDNKIRFEPCKDFSLSFRIDCLGKDSSITDEYEFVCGKIELPNHLMMTHSSSALDIVPSRAGKGTTISWFLKERGLSAKDAYGFGDAENDLSFLKLLGTTGAPGNASRAVKKQVNKVSAHQNIYGLLDFISSYTTPFNLANP